MYSSSRTAATGLEQSTKKLRSGINEKPKPPASLSSRRGSLSSMISQLRSGKSVDSEEEEDVFNESFGKLSSILDESSDSSGREKVLLDLNLDPIVTKPSPIRALPGLAQVGRSSISELRELRNSIDQSLQQPIQQNLKGKDSARGSSKTAVRRSLFKKQESDELSEVEEEVETDKDSSKKTVPKKSPFKNVVASGSSDAESIDFEVVTEPVERLRGRKVSFRTPTASENSSSVSESDSSRSASISSESFSSTTKASSRSSSSSSSSSTVKNVSSDQEDASTYEDDFEEQEDSKRPSPQVTLQSRRPSRFTVEPVEDALSPKRTRGESQVLTTIYKSLETGLTRPLDAMVERQGVIETPSRPEESTVERQSGYPYSSETRVKLEEREPSGRAVSVMEQPEQAVPVAQKNSTLRSTTESTGVEQSATLPVQRDTTLSSNTERTETEPAVHPVRNRTGTGPPITLSEPLVPSNWNTKKTETRPPVLSLSQTSLSLEDRFHDLMRDYLSKNQVFLQPQNSSGSQGVRTDKCQDSGTQTDLPITITPIQDVLVSDGVQETLRTVIETHVRMVEDMNRLEWNTLKNWQQELTLLKEHCDSPSMDSLSRLIEDRVRRK